MPGSLCSALCWDSTILLAEDAEMSATSALANDSDRVPDRSSWSDQTPGVSSRYTLTDLSADAEAMRVPSFDTATPMTFSLCPLRTARLSPE